MFSFRLALQCGFPHPRFMLEQMTSSELGEMIAYAAIEPFGEYREELRHGRMMHLLDRVHFKRDTPLLPIDFMNFTDRPKETAPEEPPEVISARIASELFRM